MNKYSFLQLFTVWAQDRAVGQANYSLEIGPEILMYFEDYFNLPYPLPKMDMVALPSSGHDGLGSWGLVTCRYPGNVSVLTFSLINYNYLPN